MSLYCLKTPKGELIPYTMAATKRGVWGEAFDFVAMQEKGFSERYWKKWDASLAAAKRMGYSIVPVELVEKTK